MPLAFTISALVRDEEVLVFPQPRPVGGRVYGPLLQEPSLAEAVALCEEFTAAVHAALAETGAQLAPCRRHDGNSSALGRGYRCDDSALSHTAY